MRSDIRDFGDIGLKKMSWHMSNERQPACWSSVCGVGSPQSEKEARVTTAHTYVYVCRLASLIVQDFWVLR